jgi:hypothetical protein
LNRAGSYKFHVKPSRLIRNAPEEVKAWATIKTGIRFSEPCSAIGVTNSRGKLIGAAIFNDYQQKNVAVSVVGKGAFRKDVLRELARFIFIDLACERVSITVRKDNELVLDLAIRAGWRVEGRKRKFFDDGCDAIIMGMLRSECNFLKGTEHGK